MKNKRVLIAGALLLIGVVLLIMAWGTVGTNSPIPGWTPVNGALNRTLADLKDSHAPTNQPIASTVPTLEPSQPNETQTEPIQSQNPVIETISSPPPQARDHRQDLNQMSLEQLDDLPGIGPSKAKAIIDYRNQHGRFTSVNELLNVKGIGQKLLDKLSPELYVS